MTEHGRDILKKAYSAEDLDDTAAWVVDHCSDTRVWLFDAPMGAGKTTLIHRIINKLSEQPFLGSPTFSIVHEYLSRAGGMIYHLDLYRLRNAEELAALGFETYLDTGDYLFIEWPEKAMPFLDNYCRIGIAITGENERLITLEKSKS